MSALVLQFLLVCWTFPVHELLTPTPITHIDAPFHAYQIEVARALCAQGRLIGYDPFFAGGHVGGVAYNASAKLQSLLACLWAEPGHGAEVYKLVAFVLAVAAPCLLALGLAQLGLPPGASGIAVLMGGILWWAGPLRWYHTAGMVSFVAAAYLSIWFSPFLLERCRLAAAMPIGPRQIGGVLFAAVAGAFGVLLHPLFAICSAVLVVSLALATRMAGQRFFPTLVVCAIVVAFTLALNLPWVIPSLTHGGWGSGASPFQKEVGLHLAALELAMRAPTAGGGSLFYPVLLACVLATPLVARTDHRRIALGMTGAGVALIVFAFTAGHTAALAILQPNRMSAVGWLFLCVPAALAAASLPEAVRNSTGLVRAAIVAVAVVAVGGSAFHVREVVLEVFRHQGPHHGVAAPEVKGYGPTFEALVDFLRENASDDGRIFFETSRARVHDGGHVAGPLALQTRKELIGGPYPNLHFAGAWDRWAFGRPIGEHDPAELERYLDLYDIHWMLCHTSQCTQALRRIAGVDERVVIGPVTVLRRRTNSTIAIRGEARVVSRGVNDLVLRFGPGSEAIVKYHWVEGLRSDPPAQISPWDSGLDPQPFIRVRDPPATLRLYMDSGSYDDGPTGSLRPVSATSASRRPSAKCSQGATVGPDAADRDAMIGAGVERARDGTACSSVASPRTPAALGSP